MKKEIESLDSILNPKTFDYEMTEKLFLDLWEEWGEPEELVEGISINEFLTQLINKSRGLIILDHFSHINYDHINKVTYEKPFLKIYWKDFNKYREKNLQEQLNEDEKMIWYVNGFSTYIYMLLNIKKVKFVKKENHLFIMFLTNFIPEKLGDKYLIDTNNELIDKENYKNLLYKKYTFFEGDKSNLIKHECVVNNLPYYSCLIQPKEKCSDTGYSRSLMLIETLQEIADRMNKVYRNLEKIDEYDYDDLNATGNKVRIILEYSLKFLCIYKDLKLDIDKGYGHIKLGQLRKEIKANYKDLEFEQRIINTANELSHDSGIVFEKEDIVEFWKEVKQLIENIYELILTKD
ncbi:hypothetical protein ABEZ76_07710 [Priestia megaterium]